MTPLPSRHRFEPRAWTGFHLRRLAAIGRIPTVGASSSRLRDDVVMTAGLELEDALRALRGPVLTLSEARDLTPRKAGLYAFYGDEPAWVELGLTYALAVQPLYVGKAERSLNGRDVRTHFASGSWRVHVRRSLAALFADSLDLVPVPRNRSKPDGSANFGLTPESDDRLSQWMAERLRLATWVKPEGVDLNEVETAVTIVPASAESRQGRRAQGTAARGAKAYGRHRQELASLGRWTPRLGKPIPHEMTARSRCHD